MFLDCLLLEFKLFAELTKEVKRRHCRPERRKMKIAGHESF